MSFVIMARDIVKNLKFKKYDGKFNVAEFAKMLDDAYLATKRPDGDMTKKSFSPSSFGYGNGNCPRYWYMAFSGAHFVDNNDAQAIANMAYGTQAHERIQKLIQGQSSDLFKDKKTLIKNLEETSVHDSLILFKVNHDNNFPFNETILPISKRKILNYIQQSKILSKPSLRKSDK